MNRLRRTYRRLRLRWIVYRWWRATDKGKKRYLRIDYRPEDK